MLANRSSRTSEPVADGSCVSHWPNLVPAVLPLQIELPSPNAVAMLSRPPGYALKPRYRGEPTQSPTNTPIVGLRPFGASLAAHTVSPPALAGHPPASQTTSALVLTGNKALQPSHRAGHSDPALPG